MVAERTISQIQETPYKVVGLIASVIGMLALFVGAVMWLATTFAESAARVKHMETDLAKYEVLIKRNADLLGQHDQLLVILDHHGQKIEVLSNFMTKGGRFTALDGKALDDKIDAQKYELRQFGFSLLDKANFAREKDLRKIEVHIKRLDEGLTRRMNILGTRLGDKREDVGIID